MSKRSRKSKNNRITQTGETRAADMLTVCWMLTVMTVVMLGLVTCGFWWFARAQPGSPLLGAFAELLYLCAGLCGCISLLLFPLVWKLRRVKPPLGVTVFAVVAAALPVILLMAGIGTRQ